MDCVFLAIMSFSLGVGVAHWSWKRKIQYKATEGFRLECDGKLYRIIEDGQGEPKEA